MKIKAKTRFKRVLNKYKKGALKVSVTDTWEQGDIGPCHRILCRRNKELEG